jgi:hypothetical protein
MVLEKMDIFYVIYLNNCIDEARQHFLEYTDLSVFSPRDPVNSEASFGRANMVYKQAFLSNS